MQIQTVLVKDSRLIGQKERRRCCLPCLHTGWCKLRRQAQSVGSSRSTGSLVAQGFQSNIAMMHRLPVDEEQVHEEMRELCQATTIVAPDEGSNRKRAREGRKGGLAFGRGAARIAINTVC